MKKFNFSAVTLATCFAFSSLAMAESISTNQYTAQKKDIESEYRSAKVGCDSLAGNANDICVMEAKGDKNVANAELKFNYKPSVKSRFGLSIAKANAKYAVAAEKCDDMAGKKKDVCVNKAKTVQSQRITDAKVEAKTMKANTATNKKLPDANTEVTDLEQMDDDIDSAVTEIEPIESDIVPFGKDIFEDQIRVIAIQ